MKRIFILMVCFLMVAGRVWGGLDWDGSGTSDEVETPSDAQLDQLGPMTISLWANVDTFTDGKQVYLFTKYTDSSNYTSCRFFSSSSNTDEKTIQFLVKFATTNLSVYADDNVVDYDVWTHWLITWDGSTTATNVHIYENGVEVGYESQTNGVGARGDDSAAILKYGGSLGNPFDGSFTEYALWNVVLGPGDRARLASSRLKGMPLQLADPDADGTDELVLYHPLDDQPAGGAADGDTARDLSIYGSHGTVDGGADNTGINWIEETILNYPSMIISKEEAEQIYADMDCEKVEGDCEWGAWDCCNGALESPEQVFIHWQPEWDLQSFANGLGTQPKREIARLALNNLALEM